MNIQFQGKYKNIKNKNKIKKLKKIFSHAKIVQTKNIAGKGWIYRIRAKNKKGKVLEDVIILDKNHISYMDDTYKCKINLKKLDKLFKMNRYWSKNEIKCFETLPIIMTYSKRAEHLFYGWLWFSFLNRTLKKEIKMRNKLIYCEVESPLYIPLIESNRNNSVIMRIRPYKKK